MTRVFLHGALCVPAMAEALFGMPIRGAPAVLDGYALVGDGWVGPALQRKKGARSEGLLVRVDAAQLARADFLAEVLGGAVQAAPLAGQEAVALVWPSDGHDAWRMETWEPRWGATAQRMVQDIVGFHAERSAADLKPAVGQMLVRASSWARAQAEETPMRVRHGLQGSDITSTALRRPYLRFFMLEEQDVQFAHFSGTLSRTVERAAFVSGDAVTVLPYDPHRDKVLLIEQFRFGPLARGDTRPWSLEPIAGRIDPGETPEDSARREAVEEAGVTLQRLERIGNYYPSPGAVSEYLFSYIGLADLPDAAAGIFGLESEAEDIRALLVSFEALMDLLHTGEAQNGPLILSALWLAANRDRLRASA